MAADHGQCSVVGERSAGGAPSFRELLNSAHAQGCVWRDSMNAHDVEREHIEHLISLTGRLLASEAVPLIAMEQVRMYLCGSCKRLNAAKKHNGCKGRALGYCPLLIERVVE